MTDTIKLPIVGAHKKQTVYVVAGGAVLILGVAYYRARGATDSTAPADDQMIDPATGFPYGSPEDAQALAAQTAYEVPSNAGGGGGAVGGSLPPGVTQFVSNSQWAQAAEDHLINVIGLDAGLVSAAIGKYIAASDVNDAQKSIIEQAIAAENYPPVAGANGYPPSIKHSADPITPPPSGGAKPKAPVIKITGSRKGAAQIDWEPIPGATYYHVYWNGRPIQNVKTTAVSVHHDGVYTVTTYAASGHSGQSNSVHVQGV